MRDMQQKCGKQLDIESNDEQNPSPMNIRRNNLCNLLGLLRAGREGCI